MENKRQSTTERRLAQVRALKERYFSEELSIEERLEAKDAKIALLENELADLRRRLERLEGKQTSTPSSRPQPERRAPSPTSDDVETRFDFYRD